MAKLNRKTEREIAFWKIFNDDFSDGNGELDLEELLVDRPDVDALSKVGDDATMSDYPLKVEKAFLDNQEAIDELIRKYLKSSWTMEKIPKAEKAIMRLALAEMYYLNPAVPKEIAINEAVNLTKRYGEDEGRRYVNGILNNITKDKPQENVDDPKARKKDNA